MKYTKSIDVFNRELFLIGQNALAKYEREQGKLEANLATAQRLFSKGFTIQEISELVNVPEDDIQTEFNKYNISQKA